MGHRRNLLRNQKKLKKNREVLAHPGVGALQRSKKKESKNHRAKHKEKDNSKYFQPITQLSFELELLDRIRSHADLFIDVEENQVLESVRTIEPYIKLAALMVQAASTQGIYLALCWPVGFEWVGLAHALASRTLAISSYGTHGLRMMLYPAVQSNYGRYRRTRFPMLGFLKEAQKSAELSKKLSLRHRAYMHLNQLEKNEDPRKHPALANAVSLFEWDQTNLDWSLYGDGYFSDVRIALHHSPFKTKTHKAQIAEYASIMADPSQASEAVFRINRKNKPTSARKIFISDNQACDLMVIDGRRDLLKGISSWRNELGTLIEQVANSVDMPSLVLLADDPATYQFFFFKMLNLAKAKRKSALPKRLCQCHWLRHTSNLWQQDDFGDNNFCLWSNINVRVTEAQSLFDISKINENARIINKRNPELARELRRIGGFLRRLVNMPVGQKSIEQWLMSTTEKSSESQAMRIASYYSWRHYRLQLGICANNTPVIDRCMKIADNLVTRITDTTSIEREVISLVLDFFADAKRTLILVEDHKYITLLETALKDNIGDSVMDFVSIFSEAPPRLYCEYDAMVVAGTSKNRLTDLLFTNQFPNTIMLLFDAYSAWTIQRDLATLKGIDAFAPIHPRIDKLLFLIEPQIKSFKQMGSIFELPADLPTCRRQLNYDYDLSAPYAMIYLSGYGVLPVGESSTLVRAHLSQQPPFTAVTVCDLTEGDRLLVIGDEQRNQISDILKEQAGRLTKDAEQHLILYFERAFDAMRQHYPQNHRAQRARALLGEMQRINPEAVKGVCEGMAARWIKHIEEFVPETGNLNSNDIKTNSPRRKEHFMFFAEALGIDSTSAQLYWTKGIYQLRIGRILEGRQLGNKIKSILTGAIELADLHMESDDIKVIFAIANECLYPVEMIVCKDDLGEEEHAC